MFEDTLPSYAHIIAYQTSLGGPFAGSFHVNQRLHELTIAITLEGDQLKYTTQHEIRREFFINAELTIEKFAGWGVYQYPEIRIKGIGRQVECTLYLYLEET